MLKLIGFNIYGLLHSKRSFSGECDIISFYHNKNNNNLSNNIEISYILSLIKSLSQSGFFDMCSI